MYYPTNDLLRIENNIDYTFSQKEINLIDYFLENINTSEFPYFGKELKHIEDVRHKIFVSMEIYDKKRLKKL